MELLSILTNKKISTLFIIFWLSTERAEAGQNFDSCLADGYGLNNPYNSLLKFPFSNNPLTSGNVQILQVCCDSSQCSPISFAKSCDSNNEFLCNKIAQNVLCVDDNPKSFCAGIVGNDPITTSTTLGTCSNDLNAVSNYFEKINISTSQKYAYWVCPDKSPCAGLMCNWDNGGWTCYPYLYNSSDVNINCFLQWPTHNSSSTSTTPNPSSISNSNNLPLTRMIEITIPAGTVVIIASTGGIIRFIIWKRRKKIHKQISQIENWEGGNWLGKKTEKTDIIELLIKERLKKEEIEKLSFFKTWFNENCTLVITRKDRIIRSSRYRLWVAVYEHSFGKTEQALELIKIVDKLPTTKTSLEEVIKYFEKALNSEDPVAKLHNSPYFFDFSPPIQNYENVKKSKVVFLPLTEPDDYIKPYDIIKVKRKGGLYQHAAIYLGKGKVAHVSNPGGKNNSWARIDEKWEDFLKGGKEVEIHHPYIPFKKPEIIKKHIDIAVGARYGEGKYHLLTNNCEHFATMCVYGLGMSQQKINVTNSIAENAKHLSQAIEESNKFFETLEGRAENEEEIIESNQETTFLEINIDKSFKDQQTQTQISPK